MSKVIKRADNEEDPFRLLPEELVIFIFDKVADLKSLCRCSLASKYFASVITQVRTVSHNISGSGTYCEEYLQRISRLAVELYCCNSEQIPSLLDTFSLQNIKLPSFLQKLRELEFIYLDYQYPETGANFPFPSLKVKFSSNSAKLERLVALVASDIHKGTENDSNEEQYTYEAEYARANEIGWNFRGHHIEWMCHLIILVKCHTSLKSVTFTDSEFNGKLVVGDVQLVYTGLYHRLKEVINLVSYKVTLTPVPVLHLPLSGYVCRWAVMVILSAPEDPLPSSKDFATIINRDFDDKLMVLREAVKEIFKNHRHKSILVQN